MTGETESREMYLKTIYRLFAKSGHVCVTDIAAELCYSKPSVTNALKRLRNLDYVRYCEGVREIELTEKGKEIAQKLWERYEFIVRMLELNGIEAERARETACRMEHAIPDDVYEILKKKAGREI